METVRRVGLVLVMVVVALFVGSSVAVAAVKVGNDGANVLWAPSKVTFFTARAVTIS